MNKLPPQERINNKGGNMLYNSLLSDLFPVFSPYKMGLELNSDRFSELNSLINDSGELEIYLDFPGVPKETIEISSEDGLNLNVKGVKQVGKIKKDINYKLSINKKFNLNETKAKLSDGILILSIPKKEDNVRKILVA